MTTFATPPSAWEFLDLYEAIRLALGGDPLTPVNTRDADMLGTKPPTAEQMYAALQAIQGAAETIDTLPYIHGDGAPEDGVTGAGEVDLGWLYRDDLTGYWYTMVTPGTTLAPKWLGVNLNG